MVYCRLCEKLRGDTGQRRRSSGRAARSSSLSLFLTLAYPLRFSLLLPAPSNGPTSCAALTLSSSRRCSSRFKTRSKSRRRGVSLWGFEGRVVSLSLDLLFPPPPPRRRPNSFHVSFPFAGSPLSFSITPPSLLLFPFPFFRSRGAVFSRVRTRTQISALAEPRIATRRGATSGFCFWIFVLCSADTVFRSYGRPRFSPRNVLPPDRRRFGAWKIFGGGTVGSRLQISPGCRLNVSRERRDSFQSFKLANSIADVAVDAVVVGIVGDETPTDRTILR